jgi:hypothetical protein
MVMNIVLKRRDGIEFFVACVKKNGIYRVLGKYVSLSGNLRTTSEDGPYGSELEARRRCQSLAKNKLRKKDFVRIPVQKIPNEIIPFLEFPTNMQITPQEMIQMIAEVRLERYVVFKDARGLEDFFDIGVEYLARITDDDDSLLVYDRFGKPRNCFIARMESISLTDEAKKAEGMGVL